MIPQAITPLLLQASSLDEAFLVPAYRPLIFFKKPPCGVIVFLSVFSL
jgi:hypothetical protein